MLGKLGKPARAGSQVTGEAPATEGTSATARTPATAGTPTTEKRQQKHDTSNRIPGHCSRDLSIEFYGCKIQQDAEAAKTQWQQGVLQTQGHQPHHPKISSFL
jgi:hypothetical protein